MKARVNSRNKSNNRQTWLANVQKMAGEEVEETLKTIKTGKAI